MMPRMLGKLPPRIDDRTLELASVLRLPMRLPREWDYDNQHPGIPAPLFANDRYGDCVIVGRAHATLRMEHAEHARVPQISEREVLDEYWRETGGDDTGLYMLDSLKQWRRYGWIAGGKRERITAYGEIKATDLTTLKAAMVARLGVQYGFALPLTARDQLEAAEAAGTTPVWTVVGGGRGARAQPGSWGGHCIYGSGYQWNAALAWTWGKRIKVSWAFVQRYADEVYGVVDQLDTKGDVLDVPAINAYLFDKSEVAA